MLALLRYHYRDPRIERRLPEHVLLRLFAELMWVRQQERDAQNAQLNTPDATR